MKRVIAIVMFAIVACVVSQAYADLVVDVKATTLNGSPVGDSQNVTISALGDVIGLEIWETTTGTDANANNDVIEWLKGAIVAGGTLTGLHGNLGDGVIVDPLDNVTGATIGTSQDLDGDGGLDYGCLPTYAGPPTKKHLYAGLAAGQWETQTSPPTYDYGGSLLVATCTYTITATGVAGDLADIEFWPRNASVAGQNAAWHQDGVGILTSSSPAPYSGGLSVQVNMIPEPSTFILLGMGALALLAFRRRK